MAKTGAQLIDTVRLRSARSNDSRIITEDFVLDCLNEAQIHIVRKTPRLIDLEASDTTTYQISTDDTSINIATLNPAHIGGIWIQNGANTRKAGLKYRPLNEFRNKYEPISQESSSEPTEYTRQGNTIYFNCPVADDYDELYLRIDYTAWATDLLNTEESVASELSNSDKGLILFALAEIYDELALGRPHFESKALKTRVLFNNWLEEYQQYNEMCLEELYDD